MRQEGEVGFAQLHDEVRGDGPERGAVQIVKGHLEDSKRCDGYLEGGGYIVSWCVGHLVELAQPEAYGETYAKWRLEDLPILPEKWQYQVSPSTKKQFQVLKGLMGREDVTSIVERCSAPPKASRRSLTCS